MMAKLVVKLQPGNKNAWNVFLVDPEGFELMSYWGSQGCLDFDSVVDDAKAVKSHLGDIEVEIQDIPERMSPQTFAYIQAVTP